MFSMLCGGKSLKTSLTTNNDVYVTGWSYARLHHYTVMVNGEVYDQFTSSQRLTFTEEYDVAAGYKEALDATAKAQTGS